jgi:hypothetical protein
MEEGWNQIVIDLADFTNKAFNTKYKETYRVSIHANCVVRRIYFTEYNLAYKKVPPDYKVFAAIDEDTIADKVSAILEE